jgi:metallo-beta-lactamase class B
MMVRAEVDPDWTTPVPPFRIADGLYYVGSRDLAAYLVVTPAGDILINANLTSSPPQIRHSVEQLGFSVQDVKILLISHAHSDHDSGLAELKRMTGAKLAVMDGDVPVVESGGAADFAYPNDRYPAVHVDHVLHDGDEVRLGGVVLIAHKTAGHTRGCTTWTMQARNSGKLRDVVIVGSWWVNPGYRLVPQAGKPASYPGVSEDYKRSFATFERLPCDIFLGAHGQYFDMLNKLARIRAGAGESVWIDPQGYRAESARAREAFEKELRRQESL